LVMALNEAVQVMHATLELRPGHFDRLGQPGRGQARSVDGEGKSPLRVSAGLGPHPLGNERHDFGGRERICPANLEADLPFYLACAFREFAGVAPVSASPVRIQARRLRTGDELYLGK